MKYDYLIVGCGLFGATFAEQALKAGKSVLIIDKRSHIGGNVFTEKYKGIQVHKYGAHIFHTSDEKVWNYVNQFASFNNFINRVYANYHGKIYSLPFNMYTFEEMWGVKKASEAKEIINKQIKEANITNITNLEEQAISLVGKDIYETLIKGYTEKQWGRPCTELPADIIKRLPVRYTFNNNYFNDKYQGIPIGGYTNMVANMIKGIDVILNTPYKDFIKKYPNIADKIIYTGPIDEYFDYKLGNLEYRSLKFVTTTHFQKQYQKCAVQNCTSPEILFTRTIEHKHFDDSTQEDETVITREYPAEYIIGESEPYYTINNERNNNLYQEYLKLNTNPNLYFKGRLGEYKYYDMDDVIKSALDFSEEILKK